MGRGRPRSPGRTAVARGSGDLRGRARDGVQDAAGRGTDGGGARRRRSVGDRESACASRQCAVGAAVDCSDVGGRRQPGAVVAAVTLRAARRAGGKRRRSGGSGTGVPRSAGARRRRLDRGAVDQNSNELVEGQFGPVRGAIAARRPCADRLRRTYGRAGHRGRRRACATYGGRCAPTSTSRAIGGELRRWHASPR